MTTLLEALIGYLSVLYLNPSYRITDSQSTGSPSENASLRLTSDVLSWRLSNDRGQIRLVVAPTKFESAENWFRLTSVRQYLDGIEERGTLLTDEQASWLRLNVGRIEQLFSSEPLAGESCSALIALEEAKATNLFGPEHN